MKIGEDRRERKPQFSTQGRARPWQQTQCRINAHLLTRIELLRQEVEALRERFEK